MATRQRPIDDSKDVELLEQLARARSALIEQIGRRIIGQHKIVDDLVAALLAGGHVLLVGVPGLAKTLLVQTVSQALDLTFSRVQFTPDLMPSDITATELLEEEERIVTATTSDLEVDIRPVLNAAQLLELQHLVRRLPAPPTVVSYAVRLARSTRPGAEEATPLVKKYVSWGAGPRASQYLILGAKARAAMDGRAVPDLDDVNAMAVPVLSHRVVVNFQAEAEGLSAEKLVTVPDRP